MHDASHTTTANVNSASYKKRHTVTLFPLSINLASFVCDGNVGAKFKQMFFFILEQPISENQLIAMNEFMTDSQIMISVVLFSSSWLDCNSTDDLSLAFPFQLFLQTEHV